MSASALPRLRPGVRLVEQTLGGERSVVVKDPETGKFFRMQAVEAAVLRLFDGTRGIGEIARALREQGTRISEGAVERFAATCARLGLLERTLAESTTLELERLRAERQRRRSLFRGELMRMRWSFGESDALLTRTMPWVRWCFTPAFVWASVALFATYAVVIAVAWPEFSRQVLDLADFSRMSGGRIATYVLVGLAVTAVHELGHAYTCKHFGGEVRELGFMLVYLQPAFYCNVNDAWSFPELRARLWVTAAGMWIQMVLAGLAAIAWWLATPGTLLSEVMLAAMIAGGLTSVLTNANPLLPLDGYFALTDWLAIPNLRQRGLAWVSWWVRCRVLGLDVPEPAATPRELRALRWYGAAAGLYITAMMTVFAAVVLRWSWGAMGWVGVAMTGALLSLMLGRPVRAWGRAIVEAVRLRSRHARARRRLALLGVAALATLLLPWRARVRGPAEAGGARDAVAVTPVDGIVTAVLVREGQRVAAGAPLARVAEPAQAAALERASRAGDSLAALARSARARGDAAEGVRLDAAARAAALERAGLAVRAAQVLRAPVAGEVATLRPERLLGRRVQAGDALLLLADPDSVELRATLAGAGARLVRQGAELRVVSLADPSARARVPVAFVAASDDGGGRIEVRARLPRADAWRPGMHAEAQVTLERTIVAVAVWRAVMERVRPEVWL